MEDLPLGAAWEVGIVELPELPKGEGLVGMLVVVDSDTGAVRVGAPITAKESLTELLLQAAFDPMGEIEPCRPAALRCAAGLPRRLKGAAKKLRVAVKVARELPQVEAARQRLQGGFQQAPAFEVDEPDAWRGPAGQLHTLAPWRQVDDEIDFSFHGAKPLDGWTALISGSEGLQRGILLLAHPGHRELLPMLQSGGSLPGDLLVPCLTFDPIDEAPEAHVAWATEAGLVFDADVAMAFALGRGLDPLSALHQRLVLAAVEAVVAAYDKHGVAVLAGPTRTVVQTSIGPVVVATDRYERPEEVYGALPLVDVAHRLQLGGSEGGVPTLDVKLTTADAERIAESLAGLAAISFLLEPGQGIFVEAWGDEGHIGTLCIVPDPDSLRPMVRAGRGLVRLLGGSAPAEASDVVAVWPVGVGAEEDDLR